MEAAHAKPYNQVGEREREREREGGRERERMIDREGQREIAIEERGGDADSETYRHRDGERR